MLQYMLLSKRHCLQAAVNQGGQNNTKEAADKTGRKGGHCCLLTQRYYKVLKAIRGLVYETGRPVTMATSDLERPITSSDSMVLFVHVVYLH